MSGLVVLNRDPRRPGIERDMVLIDQAVTVRFFLETHVRQTGLPGYRTQGGEFEFSQPTVCKFNGRLIMRAAWRETVIRDGDLVEFVTLPQGGGGGGGGGSNPLKTVLTIAIMVAAPELGAMLGAEMGITSSIGVKLLGGAIALAGSAIVNALIPPAKPQLPNFNFGGTGGSIPAASPTYSITAQGNQARLNEPIPAIYGRHLVYPDMAAEPYQEFADNEQYLHQFLCVGQGEYEIEEMRIWGPPQSSQSTRPPNARSAARAASIPRSRASKVAEASGGPCTTASISARWRQR